jgi:uncharacterized protein (TIGR02421 family)
MNIGEPNNTIIDPAVVELDCKLFEIVNNIDILDAVAPINYAQERSTFLDLHYSKNPEYTYRNHDLDPFALKRKLFALPLEVIQDEDLHSLYEGVINSYVDKVDQFSSIGTSKFLYDSLRYYGEPSEKDIRNAHFILHLPTDADSQDDTLISSTEIQAILENFGQQQGYEYQIKLDDNMIANALVSGTTIKINSSAQVSTTEAHALAHHELGVHLLTTLNARSQPLKIFSMGCPVNTLTQEGLAILSEFLAGHMSVSRLRILALRVLAVKSMIQEKDFRTTFMYLKEQYQVPDQQAFTITTRVYRGGGFTKDYVYLQGFHQMLNLYETAYNFNHLLVGKTSVEYLPAISRLIDKGWVVAPKYITPAFISPVPRDKIQGFIAHAIK